MRRMGLCLLIAIVVFCGCNEDSSSPSSVGSLTPRFTLSFSHLQSNDVAVWFSGDHFTNLPTLVVDGTGCPILPHGGGYRGYMEMAMDNTQALPELPYTLSDGSNTCSGSILWPTPYSDQAVNGTPYSHGSTHSIGTAPIEFSWECENAESYRCHILLNDYENGVFIQTYETFKVVNSNHLEIDSDTFPCSAGEDDIIQVYVHPYGLADLSEDGEPNSISTFGTGYIYTESSDNDVSEFEFYIFLTE
ncbi:MAG: hypothetical protein GY835_06435 [bacterium]|nr:hypothetical protein [bacterium]